MVEPNNPPVDAAGVVVDAGVVDVPNRPELAGAGAAVAAVPNRPVLPLAGAAD